MPDVVSRRGLVFVASAIFGLAVLAAGCSGGGRALPPAPSAVDATRAPQSVAAVTVVGKIATAYAGGFSMQVGAGCGRVSVSTTTATTIALNGLTLTAGVWAQVQGSGSCATGIAATAVSLAATRSGPFPVSSGSPAPATATPTVTPTAKPSATATATPTATPVPSPGPTPFSVTGQIISLNTGGFLVQAGPGCGYLDVLTNGSTVVVLNGQSLRAGVYARAFGTGSCATSIVASVVSLAATAAGPFPLPTPVSTPSPSASAPAYVAMGDSVTVGYGTSAACPPNQPPSLPSPPNCPAGAGYAPVVARALNGGAVNPSFVDLGISGAPINAADQAIGDASYGPGGAFANVIANEMPFAAIANQDVITLYVGINDVDFFYAAATAGPGASNPTAYADNAIATFGSAYTSLVTQIRGQMKPGAKLILINLPNLGQIPRNAGQSQAPLLTRMSVGIDQQYVNPLASQVYAVIDLLCDSNSYAVPMISADGLHPNDLGAANIANKITSALTGGAVAPASCPLLSS